MTLALLLHGFTGAPSSFTRVLEALPRQLSALTPRLVGHGTPPAAPEVRSFEDEVDRLAELIPRGERALVVGYSLGARLGLGLLVRHAARCSSAILISGSAGLVTAAERTERRKSDSEWCRMLETQGLESFVERWSAQPLFESQRKLALAERDAERFRRLEHTAAGLCHSLSVTGLGGMPSYQAALRDIRCPVELLAGELDARFCAHAEAMAAELAAGRFTRLAGAGHNLLLERPSEVAEAIARGELT